MRPRSRNAPGMPSWALARNGIFDNTYQKVVQDAPDALRQAMAAGGAQPSAGGISGDNEGDDGSGSGQEESRVNGRGRREEGVEALDRRLG
jgi:hypothetical protein